MQFSFNELQYVVGSAEIAAGMPQLRPLKPFAEETLRFLNDLSVKLRTAGRDYPDVATFGFWCRRAALLQEKAKYDDLAHRYGRGVVFHSTPSNVPVNFAFSFAAGLLAGNANIVRLPGKPFAQVELIAQAIGELLAADTYGLAPYVCFVKYPPSKAVTDVFSALCDSRVIWGGDGTINEIRQSPIKPRATEITFADRHSIAVIDADAYLVAEDKDRIANDFFNDTYYSDQNACTAPRILFWIGEGKDEAKRTFWAKTHQLVQQKYQLAPVQAVGKLAALYRAAAQMPVQLEPAEDMLVTRVSVQELVEQVMDYKYNSGFFFESDIRALDELLPVCTRRCQTLTYYGLKPDQLNDFFERCRPQGVDRAVPMGKSMDFALIWDGYDLIRTLSRRITTPAVEPKNG